MCFVGLTHLTFNGFYGIMDYKLKRGFKMIPRDPIKDVRPDSRKRIHLGELAKGVDGYKIYKEEDSSRLILEPYAEIPLSELWVFQNNGILLSLDEADKQLLSGKKSRLNLDDWDI